ncbi:MAG TPA: CoA-acylating methylmalonate-semialdehyde dehydrogenase [Acidimicrobiales bacterium]|nr:CoA-acylating methylmalonate-semialdehyde dehydrogenase [Acidimicrobiales bacterium]
MKRITHWIDGKPFVGDARRHGKVYNPATGVQSAEVDFATDDEVNAAVAAAFSAFPEWRATSLARRSAAMFALRELLVAHAGEIADLIVAEHGKVKSDAAGEVARGLEVVEFACGIAQLLKGEFTEGASTGVNVHSLRQPLGVVAGITPFNFPAMVPLWMFPLAIASGNTFVLKPSEKDPSASLLLAELVAEAGVPNGVFNVVQGDKVAVDRILRHPDIKAVSFVGSTAIARYIYETAAHEGKRVQALGGAKNHMIVLPDADLADAAEAAVSAGFGSAGERCMAASVLVAVDGVGDELVERIRARVDRLTVGDGTNAASEMGPLVTREHRDKVASYLSIGQAAGATVAIDGREHDIAGDPNGFWLGPCLIDNVTEEMQVYTDEIFGPVLSMVRVDTVDDAIALVQRNGYGNGVAIFTSDGGAAQRFETEVEAGMVGINVAIPVPVAYYSFGGWNDSLFGDLHVYGPDGVKFYTRGKAVTSRWANIGQHHATLSFPANATHDRPAKGT